MTAVDDFDFALPSELIAQDAAPRGESRLLVLDRAAGSRVHASVRDVPHFLRAGDLLVANDTKVFPARLIGRRVPSGGVVECVLLAREERVGRSEVWSALVHPGKKLKPGATMRFESGDSALMADVLDRQFFGRRTIRLWSEHGDDIDALVDRVGRVPLPPYIHRSDTDADRERYQTVFAARRGSVAAPTAGLHFDRALLDAVERAGVERATVTLHVGYGTFKPVRAAQVEDHVVDPEPYEISDAAAAAINRALVDRRRVIAIGTTTTRALEDAAQRGDGRMIAGCADARLFIHSGFRFQAISGLVTNFHLPRSSLLMLVASFAGREHVLAAYRDAIDRRYRFYSYGDAMLVI